MDDLITLTIKTPVKVVFEGKVKQITLPTVSGKITIMPNHVNLVTMIEVGMVEIHSKESFNYLCFKGLARVQNNIVTILTENAALPEESVLADINAAIDSAKNGKPTSVILTEDLIKAEKELKYILLKDKNTQ